jgi:hypothetical protein
VAGFVKAENTTANSGSVMFACRSRGTLAAPTVVQNGDSLWNMYLAGYDGTDLALAAEIDVQVDGVPGSNDMPGRILFKTTPDGSQTPAERMRIHASGGVSIAGAVDPGASNLTLSGATTNFIGIVGNDGGSGGGAKSYPQASTNSLTYAGGIAVSTNVVGNILTTGTVNTVFGYAGGTGVKENGTQFNIASPCGGGAGGVGKD